MGIIKYADKMDGGVIEEKFKITFQEQEPPEVEPGEEIMGELPPLGGEDTLPIPPPPGDQEVVGVPAPGEQDQPDIPRASIDAGNPAAVARRQA